MKIPDAEIVSLKQILEEEFHRSFTIGEAETIGNQLLAFVCAVHQASARFLAAEATNLSLEE
jgi:hypothetical protein